MTHRSSVFRLVLCVAAALSASLFYVVLAPGLAQASEVHVYSSSFGGEGTGAGKFKEPRALAVNDSTHDVYVVDVENNRVEEFTSGGVYIGQFDGAGAATGALEEPGQIAIDNSGNAPVDPSAEDVYVVDRAHGVIDKFEPSGTLIDQITGAGASVGSFEPGAEEARSIKGLAVDQNGVLWVSTLEGPIYRFSDELENKFETNVSNSFNGAQEGLAVDAKDNLFLDVGGEFAEISDTGEVLSNPFGKDTNAFRSAVDPISEEVYLDSRENIEAFNVDGERLESFGSAGSGFAGLSSSLGVAVDASNGTVYVSDQGANDVSIFAALQVPTIGEPSERQPRGLTLNGSVDPEGGEVGSCVFEYGPTTAYTQSAPCSPASLGNGTAYVPVSARLTGLTPESSYHYRLVVVNKTYGSVASTDGEFFAGPKLGGEFVTEVTSGAAALHGQVNADGGDTHYYFEYGTTAAYGSYAPLRPPGADLGSTATTQRITAYIEDLEAGRLYHYRLIAVQGGETFADPDQTFTTQGPGASVVLPDGRQWELVSPADDRGALIEQFQLSGQIQAAADGGGFTYITKSFSPGENPQGNFLYNQVLSRRTGDGWKTVDLTLPARLPTEEGVSAEQSSSTQLEYQMFNPDLSLAVVEPQLFGTPPLAQGVSERTLYLRDDLSESFGPLVTSANIPAGKRVEEPNFTGADAAQEFQMHFLTATPDLNHVVFASAMALTPEAIDEDTVHDQVESGDVSPVPQNLYEWSEGALQLVNVLPESEASLENKGIAYGLKSRGIPGVRLAGTINFAGLGRGGAPRAVSSDGRRVAWTWGDPYTSESLGEYRGLYVRDMVEKRTLRVGGPDAIYQTMNSSGSKVFFLENEDLYEFNFETDTQTDLTAAQGLGESSAGVQQTVSDVSEDGSYAYFVATGVLAVGAKSGEDNLYLLHDGEGGWEAPRYLATLSPQDRPSWFVTGDGEAPHLALVSSRVSPDGRYLAFMSNRSLTGYDNTDAVSGEPDEEVYWYDADADGDGGAGKLVCASCDPTGARPRGVFDKEASELLVDRPEAWAAGEGSSGRANHWLAGNIPGWDNVGESAVTYQPRYLSNSGRLFFNSPDALVPQDTNGLEDVYEFEPAGTLGPEGAFVCDSSVSSGDEVYVNEVAGHAVDGCVGLISSGSSSLESAFYDASENGDDIFFTTAAKLASEDYDTGYDVYDAHVCSSAVPCSTALVAPPPCSSGDSCKVAPTPQPTIFGAAPTATFNGAGNITPPVTKPVARKTTKKAVKRCAKGRKRIRGRCVRRSKSKKTKTKRANNHRRAAR